MSEEKKTIRSETKSESSLEQFLKFLNTCSGKTPEEKLHTMANHRIKKMKLSIQYKKIKIKSSTFYILNYNQLTSPFDPMACVCRSLLLGHNSAGFYPIARSYDRFPDYHENKTVADQMMKLMKKQKFHRAYEKVDGSIMMVTWLEDLGWVCMSRSTMGTGTVGRLKITFGELLADLLHGDINEVFTKHKVDRAYTWIFEVYHPDGNHVITRYPEKFACLLDGRTLTGTYADISVLDSLAEKLRVRRPRLLAESVSIEEMQNKLSILYKDNPLFEGAVLAYDIPSEITSTTNRIMIKMKHPSYYIFHKHMENGRGPCLTIPDVALRLNFMGSLEDEIKAQKCTEEEIVAIRKILSVEEQLLLTIKKLCSDCFETKNQKDYSRKIDDFPLKKFLFKARSMDPDTHEIMYQQVISQWNENYETVIDVIKKIMSI